jgi:DNA-binding NarL/FixJ family response regulator
VSIQIANGHGSNAPVPHTGFRQTRLAIASLEPQKLRKLAARLSQEPGLVVVDSPITDSKLILSYLEVRHLDVLLLDVQFLLRAGLHLVRIIHRKHSALRVLLMCGLRPDYVLDEIMRNHIHGYVAIDADPEYVIKATRTIVGGGLWMPRAELEKAAVERFRANNLKTPASFETALTCREAEAVRYVTHGLTNKEIGHILGIREDTVKKHLRSVYVKLGVNRRTELMVLCQGV